MHISHKLQLFPYGPPIAAALHLHTSLSHRKKKGNSLLHSCAFFAIRILSENFAEIFCVHPLVKPDLAVWWERTAAMHVLERDSLECKRKFK